MIDYYKELGLSVSLSTKELLQELEKLERVWIDREVRTPEKARKVRVLIDEAKDVFKNEQSRREYDKLLEESKKPFDNNEHDMSRIATFEKWSNDARKYYNNQMYDLGKAAIEKAMNYADSNSDNMDFLWLAALIYDACDESDIALNYINKAIISSPNSARLFITKGCIYQHLINSPYHMNEYEKFFCKSNETFLEAVKIADTNCDVSAKADSLGHLAYLYYYFSPLCDEALKYADQAIHLCHTQGLALQVINDEKKRLAQEKREKEEQEKIQREKEAQLAKEKELRRIEEQRKAEEHKRRIEEYNRKKEEERRKNEEFQNKRNKAKKLVIVAYIAFLIPPVYVLLCMFTDMVYNYWFVLYSSIFSSAIYTFSTHFLFNKYNIECGHIIVVWIAYGVISMEILPVTSSQYVIYHQNPWKLFFYYITSVFVTSVISLLVAIIFSKTKEKK